MDVLDHLELNLRDKNVKIWSQKQRVTSLRPFLPVHSKPVHDEAHFMAALTENIQVLAEGGGGLRGLIRRHSHGKKGG